MSITNILLAGATGIILGIALIKVLELYRSSRIKPMVLVVLNTGETIRGALLEHRRRHIALGTAELLEGGKATGIDGTTYIDRANIRWIQEPHR